MKKREKKALATINFFRTNDQGNKENMLSDKKLEG